MRCPATAHLNVVEKVCDQLLQRRVVGAVDLRQLLDGGRGDVEALEHV